MAATLYSVSDRFTVLVEGNTFGNIEVTVDVSPPNKNIEEKKNPKPSFFNVLTLNKSNNPEKVTSGNR